MRAVAGSGRRSAFVTQKQLDQIVDAIVAQAQRNHMRYEALLETLYARHLPSNLRGHIIARWTRATAGILIKSRAGIDAFKQGAKAFGIKQLARGLGVLATGASLLTGWMAQEETDAGRQFPPGVQGARNVFRGVTTTATSGGAAAGTFAACTFLSLGIGILGCAVGGGVVGVGSGLWADDRVDDFFGWLDAEPRLIWPWE
jgi:hypothetical protein